ncbi:MAG: elongation factor P [Proteobacteria bacterium]|nr:elongation factor P [Pseudomonadota bacterium]
MYDTSEFRKGLRIEIDDHPYIIVENQFVKPGKGQAFNRVKIKSLLSGNVLDRTYKSGEKVKKADIAEQSMQFLYSADNAYHFMNNDNYEQLEIQKEQIGDNWKWLQEGMAVDIMVYKGLPVSITVPNFTVLEITHCEPGIKGDTATSANKPATLSTGAVVFVPLFVNQNEKIKIDTRTGDYVERVKG